jgi:hypothetical protein
VMGLWQTCIQQAAPSRVKRCTFSTRLAGSPAAEPAYRRAMSSAAPAAGARAWCWCPPKNQKSWVRLFSSQRARGCAGECVTPQTPTASFFPATGIAAMPLR